MELTNRPGVAAESSSIRVQVTALAGSASTFFEMKTRPVVVAAHALDESAVVRSMAATFPPARLPQAALVKRGAPSSAQSPHVSANVPVHSLQIACASATVLLPRPAVFVLNAVCVPAKSVFETTGSEITGE